jgi:hypothetical protein
MPFSIAAIDHRKSSYCGSLLLEVLIYQPIYQNNMLFNYTIQDMLSLALAILLFSVVLVFPGYVIGWALNFFSFRRRKPFAQYVIAIALSNALIPALLFLSYRFFSNQHGIGLIVIFFILWLAIQIGSSRSQPKQKITRELKISLTLAGLWILFCILLLVDIQIGPKLYFNVAAYDFTSRTPLIEAITRTGIPPINPTYYPGHFERITELYYFWYIPGSVVDVLGGPWVDARIALFAGITWSGFSLATALAIYLRIRNPQSGPLGYRSALIGSQMIAVSGLDFIPVTAIMIAVKLMYGILPFEGRVEAWNVPIMSWLNALTWVPNHVAGLAACVISLLAILSSFRGSTSQRWMSIVIAGIAIGSAIGLSVWVALTFGIFMAIWCLAALFNRSQRSIIPVILASGILGLVLVSQFLIEALQLNGTSSSAGSLPLGVYVRRFSLTGALAPGTREVVGTLLLPVNYFFELGFFFVIALLWFKQRRKSGDKLNNPYFLAETLLLVTVVILLSFVRSTALLSNDLGMRGWLLGQFVLIVWAVDIFNATSKEQVLLTPTLFKSPSVPKRINDLLTILLTVGLLTTALEATATRFWTILVDTGVTGVPNELSPDTNLGERTYDARRAYEYIRDHTPQKIIIQNNPTTIIDRPSGLYGTRQMVIADRTAYGVPIEIFTKMSTSVGRIFLAKNAKDWSLIDQICSQYSIQAIVVNDTDPLWSSLQVLKEQRTPIYLNGRYAVFPCGNHQ